MPAPKRKPVYPAMGMIANRKIEKCAGWRGMMAVSFRLNSLSLARLNNYLSSFLLHDD